MKDDEQSIYLRVEFLMLITLVGVPLAHVVLRSVWAVMTVAFGMFG